MALAAAPTVAHAQVTVSGGISFNFGSLPGDPVGDVDVFYDQLSPYGVWVDDPMVNQQVFIPDQSNYVPYTNGHWEDTDVGFVWVSSEPFAWATSHYGRWYYDNDYGRWAWLPDTTWGPSWVDWYESDDAFGWAPLAPDIVIQAGYQPPIAAYHYCPPDRLLDANVASYYVPRERVADIQRRARPVSHTETARDHKVVTGPAPDRLQAHRVAVKPKRVTDVKTLGVLDRSQARTIEARAKQRKPQIEQQNQKRLDQHADLKRAVETKAQKSPNRRPEATRPETTRPETTRPETTRPEQRTPAQPENRTRTDERNQPQRTTRPEPRPETTRPEPTERTTPPRANERGDMNRAQPTRPEPKAQPPRPEPQRTEPTRPEPKAEPTRPEPQRTEPTRPEPQRTEPTRPEPQRTEPTRPEPQRAEPTRPEPQRAEPPRPEPQRTEPPRAEPKAAMPHGNANGNNKDKRKEH